MISRRSALRLLAGLAALPAASCLATKDTVTLQGCGATFPAPLYERWFLEYYKRNPNVRVNYLAIGSGAGVSQFSNGLVQFGATDESLNAAKIADIEKSLKSREGAEVKVLQVPMTAGTIAVCYNLPGQPQLRLSRKALSDVVLGNVTTWDDEEIRKTNPDVPLPHAPITFVRRAEGSGTTFNFTNHLVTIDPQGWKAKGLKAGKTVDWPVGLGGKGNDGVTATIKQTPGALGYIEASYAALSGLPTAALQNRAGNFVQPTEESALVALEEAKFNAVNAASVPDPTGSQAYPIVTFTWIICRTRYAAPRMARALKAVLLYCLGEKEGEGQSFSAGLHYTPLPARTAETMRKVVEQIGGERADNGEQVKGE